MGEAPHHYLIFETTGGFCGIAWNNVGITRFQLPTKSAVAAERTLLRRVPGAERGAPRQLSNIRVTCSTEKGWRLLSIFVPTATLSIGFASNRNDCTATVKTPVKLDR